MSHRTKLLGFLSRVFASRVLVSCMFVSWVVAPQSVLAQDAAGAAGAGEAGTAPAPVLEAAPTPALASAPAPSASASPACFPACRAGFVCGPAAQCISACNPPCDVGERCTANGACELDSRQRVAPAAPAPAAPASPEQGVETHDGVMLRFTVGLAGGSMREAFDDPRPTIADERTAVGGGFMGSIDLGGALTDELTLHGRIALMQIFDPELETDGRDVSLPYEASLVTVLLGPGLTYNIMPLNLYITGVIGLHVITFVYDEEDEDFDEDFRDDAIAGVGLNLDVGKEWWVTTQTGIGVAARFSWGNGGGEYELLGLRDSTRNVVAFGVLFSVTHQ